MKKILTIIMDGFGMREDIYGNAVKMAGMNNFINIWNNYPHCLLKASGNAVGLPEEQCGSSEYGHEIIGTGREIENKLVKLNSIFSDSLLKNNEKFNEMIQNLRSDSSKNLHITILLSDGGVSSHINHVTSFIDELNNMKVDNEVLIHLISDGRDADRYSIKRYITELTAVCNEKVKIASICGRYYALDTTKDYKRTKLFYDLLTDGKGVEAVKVGRVIDKCYEKKLSDEYLPPIKTANYSSIKDGDIVFFASFGKENQFQILNAFCNKEFDKFNTASINFQVYSLFEIDKEINTNYFYEASTYNRTLTEYLSELGLTQAHIFESVRESAMTYYINGNRKLELNNCDKYIIPSPKVDSFDMKPEMDALSLAKTTIKCMEKDYDFVMVNFANADEVGHTGNYPATINSLQAIDVCLGKILEVAEENFYKVVIISSHGKADTIIDRDNNIITKNTLSPVPFIIMDNKIKLNNGKLSDFTATLLKYMDIAVPKEMKNHEILISKK